MIIFALNVLCAVHRSGSGKTCNLKRALSYLVKTTVDPEQPVPSSFSGEYAFLIGQQHEISPFFGIQ
jgi:hypothetical protein